MTDLAVRIAYRGEGFSGSQIQPGLTTVEGTLLSSLIRVTELPPEKIDLKLASRTDKGVNATGNVASFESGGADPVLLLKALNSVGWGVLCTAYARVGDDFLPRHADMRTYEYVTRPGNASPCSRGSTTSPASASPKARARSSTWWRRASARRAMSWS